MEQYKILFIDDEQDVLSSLEKIFINDSNLKLFFANNAEESLNIMNKNNMDIIVSDQNMHEMSGIDLFKITKNKYPDSLRILLTGQTNLDEVIKAINEGEIYRYISKPWDILELKGIIKTSLDYIRLEKENKKMIEEIRQYNIELENANKELEAFSYSVSHDLKAPLRSISSFSQVIIEEYGSKFDDELRRLFDIIRKKSLHMEKLIDSLLKLFKVSKKNISCILIDQNELIKKIIEEMNSSNINIQNINFKINNMPAVFADYELLYQVWFNLISNAVKYSSKKDSPEIIINSSKKDNTVICSIKDNGVGFDSAHASKLFKPFQRLHSESEFQGSGIGLTIVEKIIEKHGGKIWAESKLDNGAEFFFSLPDNMKQ